MKVDLLIAEIGSTTTIVNGFQLRPRPKFIGQGQWTTTVNKGDVNIGLKNAIRELARNIGKDHINYKELLASSSAAGGLRMTVHGLVYDMTVRAAKEAALGAGANIKLITAASLRESDLDKIKNIGPNIILIAGGVDYGERDTALHNAQLISQLNLNIPIIYAGNIENQGEVRDIFKGIGAELYLVQNVYPKIDVLNIEPTRRIIQDIFEKHIIHAPGMKKIRKMVTGSIMPTPGAVMEASKFLYERIGDLMTVDVGGATTDIHSVTKGSEKISKILINPEPLIKRTVEGDLGLYVNMSNILNIIGEDELRKRLKLTGEEFEKLIKNHRPIPDTDLERRFAEELTLHAILVAVKRHAGRLRDLYGPSGKTTIAEGRDLTQIKTIIGTGGSLSRLFNGEKILKELLINKKGNELLPGKESKILIDNNYLLASLGIMSRKYPQEALDLMKESLDLQIEEKERSL